MNKVEPKAFPGLGQDGLTMRDYFAAKAMQSLILEPWYTDQQNTEYSVMAPHIASDAYILADAMMKARGEI